MMHNSERPTGLTVTALALAGFQKLYKANRWATYG